jgi:3-mercaptopyruvate sulfurtransferase SseA
LILVENTQQYRDIRNFIVETDWLEHHLSDDNLRVYDCSVIVKKNTNIKKSLQQPFVYQSAHSEYELEHIPGAGFIDIPGELSDLTSDLPLMLPLENKDTAIINALVSAIHTGEIAFGRRGRISTSVNVSFASLQDPNNGCYFSIERLQKYFRETGTDKSKRTINYCSAGIAASNNAFTLSLLGYRNMAGYDGSMLEWGNDRSLPMEAYTQTGIASI